MFRLLCRRNLSSFKRSPQVTAVETVEDDFKTSIHTIGSPSDWAKLRNRILKNRFYSQVNVDTTILGLCGRHGTLDNGRSYVRFLEQNQIPLTAAIAGKYLKLFILPAGQETLDVELSQEVLRICESIQRRHPVLDGNTAESLINAKCLTSSWKEAITLLEHVKEFGHPSHAPFNAISQAAFRNREPDVGISILEEGMVVGRSPSGSTLNAWITYGADIVKLLEFLQRHNLQIPEQVATTLKRHLENSGVNVQMSSVSRNKICGSCRTNLDEITLSDDEFRLLQDTFHEKVLIKDNIFIKSTPQEFNDFQRFLERSGPFDCVIDGLNVAYSVGGNRPVNSLSGHILAAMKYFTQEKKRVLILGREHMKRWPNFVKRVESNNGQVFLTENLSQDDPFFIYAALKSGPKCDIFSRDLLRTHAHQLGPELGPMFRRWQRIHQYSYKSPTTSSTPKLFVEPPIKYKIEAHQNTLGHWHVPWSEGGNDYAVNRIPEVPFEVPVRWMCFRL